MRRHLPLIVLAATATALLTVVLVYSTRALAESIEREALLQQRHRAGELAARLDAQLLVTSQVANTAAAVLVATREPGETEAMLMQLLRSTSPEAVHGIGVWFEPYAFDGKSKLYGPYVHRMRNGDPELTHRWSTPEYDYPSRPWYQLGRSTGETPAFTEPYPDVDAIYMTTTRSLYDAERRMVGVVSVDMILPQLRDAVARANVSPGEAFYVTTPGGKLFAHPDELRVLAWARANGREARSILDFTLADVDAFDRFQHDRRERHEVMVPHSGWRVHVASDRRTLFAASMRIRWISALLVALVWLVGLVSLVARVRRLEGAALAREVERHDAAEKVLRESMKQRDEFLSLASHELRTPLTPLIARLIMAQRQLRAGKPVDPANVDRALAAAHRVTKLIDDLLDVSRAQSARLSIHPEATSLTDIVQKAVAVASPSTGRRLQVDLPEDPMKVYGDASRLEQVVTNLLTNAFKYSPEGTCVRVSLEARGGDAVLSVADEGIGIPDDERGHVFERYYRASNAPARSFAGLGIGLYVCQDIVTAHGGRIWVDAAPGGGSVFRVALPRLEDVSVSTLVAAAPRRSSYG